MADYWAKNNGIWSNRTNWLTAIGQDAGSLPTPADDVWANNFTITADDSFHVSSIRNVRLTSKGIAAGGQFVLSGQNTQNFRLTAFVYGGGVSEVPCLRFQSNSPFTGTLIGSLCAGDPGNTVLRPIAFRNLTTNSVFTIIGDCLGGLNNNTDATVGNALNGFLINSSTGTLSIIGSVSGEIKTSSTEGRVPGIHNVSSGVVNITGNVEGGSTTSSFGVYNRLNGVVNILGTVNGSFRNANAPGAINVSSLGLMNITGSVFGNSSIGISNSNAGSLNIRGGVIAISNTGITNTGIIFLSGSVEGSRTGANVAGISNQTSGKVDIVGPLFSGRFANTRAFVNNSGCTVSVSGNLFGRATQVSVIENSGQVNIFGNIFPWETGIQSYGINNAGVAAVLGTVNGSNYGNEGYGIINTGTVSVTGLVRGGVGGFNNVGIRNTAGSIYINGTVIGGDHGTGLNRGIFNSGNNVTIAVSGTIRGSLTNTGLLNTGSSCIIRLSGEAIGGGGAGCNGIDNTGANCNIRIKQATGSGFGLFSAGNVTDRAIGNGVAITNSQLNTFVGVEGIKSGLRGSFPTSNNVFVISSFSGKLGDFFQMRTSAGGKTVSFIRSSDFLSYIPSPADVRLGTPYGGLPPYNLAVGACVIPNKEDVIFGVPVDDSTGVGYLDATQAWTIKTRDLVKPGSMGVYLRRSLTINTLSALILSLNA